MARGHLTPTAIGVAAARAAAETGIANRATVPKLVPGRVQHRARKRLATPNQRRSPRSVTHALLRQRRVRNKRVGQRPVKARAISAGDGAAAVVAGAAPTVRVAAEIVSSPWPRRPTAHQSSSTKKHCRSGADVSGRVSRSAGTPWSCIVGTTRPRSRSSKAGS